MELAMIGLGRMGSGMASRLLKAGHRCVVYDINPSLTRPLQIQGALPAQSLAHMIQQLPSPRVVWIMLPAAVVDDTLSQLGPLLEEGDTVVDGGNSYYADDIRRAAALRAKGIHYVDVGTSGGLWGAERGYCLMYGGEREVVARLEPLFADLAPGLSGVTRTSSRTGEVTSAEHGYLHCGPSGAGHFVKMVHNGIEYGIMAAYSEGFNLLRHAQAGMEQRSADAETTPLRHPEHYQYELDLPAIAEVWRRGSVISSWLLDLTAEALNKNPDLQDFAGRVADSGEGRWTLAAAIEASVPVPVLSAALFTRFSSRGEGDFANRLLSALRFAFGGHAEKHAEKP